MPALIPGRDSIGDGSMAVAFRLLKELTPPAWCPAKVLLTRHKPADIGPYARLFNAPVEFGANAAALVFSAHWLDEPIRSASKTLRTLLEQHLDETENHFGAQFSDQVRRVLLSGMGTSEPSAEKVAATLSMSRRTLSRRLREENMTFREVLGQVRCAMGRNLIESTDASINEIAQQLGYSEPSVFIRAFRRWTGSTPNAWRFRERG
jgi:AraC-like DNA-binding protein